MSRHWRSSHYIDEKQDDPVLATLPPAAPPQDLDTGTYGGEEDVEGAQNGVLVWSDDYFNFRFEGVFKLVPDQQDSKYTLYKGQVLVQKKQEPLDEPCDASAVAQGSLYEFETKDLVVQKALFRLLRTSADNLGIKLERPRASQVSLKTIWGLLRYVSIFAEPERVPVPMMKAWEKSRTSRLSLPTRGNAGQMPKSG